MTTEDSPKAMPAPMSLAELIDRRAMLKGGLLALSAAMVGCSADKPRRSKGRLLSFESIAASSEDKVRVPKGYSAKPVALWGDRILPGSNAQFREDASNSASDQRAQLGMNFDGMEFFPLPDARSNSSEHGLLALNHEYVDRGLIHAATPGFAFTPDQILKEMHAQGVSVIEVQKVLGAWQLNADSKFNRRVTAATPIRISGPAAGHDLMRTSLDPKGELIHGTMANCSAGRTPWGTYLSCEENFQEVFSHSGKPTDRDFAYGIREGLSYEWAKASPASPEFQRFDAGLHPNEPNRFGWVVEVDPYDPTSMPAKRTALGRFRHENAALLVAEDGRVVVYMGDDEADQYLYKFVSDGVYDPDPAKRDSMKEVLEKGTLYVAHFDGNKKGRWVELSKRNPALKEFQDDATILIFARMAAKATGQATPMDRPEWIAIDPFSDRVYATLTNNALRKEKPKDPANPRAANLHGHIIWWRETAGKSGEAFEWDVFLLAGDPKSKVETNRGNLESDLFSSPDGLAFDPRGVLWIQTDISNSKVYHPEHRKDQKEYKAFGNNQMLAVDRGGKGHADKSNIRRFLTGPNGCEITGFSMTPDLRTLFINIQHPGEPLDPGNYFNDPANPTRYSTWPNGTRPRSGLVVITKDDGGLIGT